MNIINFLNLKKVSNKEVKYLLKFFMTKYIIKRILYIIPVLFIVSVIVFSFLHMIPGDPIRIMLGVYATPEQIEILTKQLNLDKPLIVQYMIWLKNILKGDFGNSIRLGIPVTKLIISRLPTTISLATYAMIIAMIIAIFAGVIAAAKRNTFFDLSIMAFALFGISIPAFLMGVLLILLFALTLNLFPSIGYKSFFESPIIFLRYMTLPALALAVAIAGSITRVTRTQMIEILGQDYIKTAQAKGVKEISVILKHALKNSLVPIITLSGMFYATTLGGTIIIEEIFALPGIGRLVFQAIFSRDYPVVQGVVLFIATINVTFNLIIDILYRYLNPKIQLK